MRGSIFDPEFFGLSDKRLRFRSLLNLGGANEMRVVVQRVSEASVTVDGHVNGQIGRGLLVLAGFEETDGDADLDWMAGKIVRMRIMADENGVMNRSVLEAGGEILAVSQFTLFASVKKGNRPSWSRAARGEVSQPLFARFVDKLSVELGKPVPTGMFGADMQVALVNDGPVTLSIDSRQPEKGASVAGEGLAEAFDTGLAG